MTHQELVVWTKRNMEEGPDIVKLSFIIYERWQWKSKAHGIGFYQWALLKIVFAQGAIVPEIRILNCKLDIAICRNTYIKNGNK